MDKGWIGKAFNKSALGEGVELTSSIGVTALDDKLIDTGLNSSTASESGYIGRSDLSGFAEYKRKRRLDFVKEAKKDRDFLIILASIQALQENFKVSIEEWSTILEHQNDLAGRLLDDLNQISAELEDIIHDHIAIESFLDEGSVYSHLDHPSIVAMLERYKNRIGELDNSNLVSILNDQMLYEKSKTIPNLQTQKYALNKLIEENGLDYDASIAQKSSIEEMWVRILQMPDSEEKEQRMREILEQSDNYQMELIDQLEISENDRMIIMNEITDKNDDLSSEELEALNEKNTEFTPLANFDFNQ